MNREIKFRGKLKEKGMKPVFFEGSLIHVTSTYKGEEDEQECNVYQIVNEDGVAFFVEEETIRTIYSDYTIKMEKKYMSGDIILTQPLKDKPFSQKAKSKRLRGIVKYQVLCGKNFIGEPDKVKYWGAEWDIEIIDKKDYEKYHNYGWGLFFECEVIGNIYDSPELLGGE